MKRCFKKKNLKDFCKCLKKTFFVFWISIFYAPFFLDFRERFFWGGDGESKNFALKKVWVGVSGGVDSSVSALLLKKDYKVFGCFIKVYQPDEAESFCWRNELLDAKKICKKLKIPFVFLNLEKEYKKNIFDYMIGYYKKGLTPNPDVFCNKYIKFGSFLEKAIFYGAEKVAMGHYAQNFFDEKKQKYFLKKGHDEKKDQSYFLSSISQAQLSRAIFPIGDLEKKNVRKIAEKNNLFTAEKKDSQGLCFVGKINMKKFLQNFIEKKVGKVLDLKGEEIGRHDGAFFYTIGQRGGFEIFAKYKSPNMEKIFVLKKDIEKNTITIGPKNPEVKKILEKKEIFIKKINWISGNEPDFFKNFSAMIRYRGENIEAFLEKISEDKILVKFESPQSSIASGQILVIYDGEICLGQGEIC